MGIFAVALSGPSGSALPTLRGNMKQPLQFKKVLLIALGLMTVVYGLVGSVGYYYFGSKASQLITVDLETKSLLSHVKAFGLIRVSICALCLTCCTFWILLTFHTFQSWNSYTRQAVHNGCLLDGTKACCCLAGSQQSQVSLPVSKPMTQLQVVMFSRSHLCNMQGSP